MAEKKEKRYVSDNAQLMAEWDWEKNNELGLQPDKLTCGSNKKVWWKCSKGHLWFAVIASRVKGSGCPYCSNMYAWKGYNDLLTTHPELAKQWHPYKNGNLQPSDVTAGSGKNVWWLGECGHEWISTVSNRKIGNGCPICKNNVISQKVSLIHISKSGSLLDTNSKLAKEWHPTKNKDLLPSQITAGSTRLVWWLGECGHEWQASPSNRSRGTKCPFCTNQKALKGFNDLETLFPEIASEWHPKLNGSINPSNVVAKSNKSVWWLGKCGHEWRQKISNRTERNQGCSICAKRMQTSFPEQALYFYVKKICPDAINSFKEIFDNKMELDVFIPSLNVGIEYDGINWHGDNDSERKEKNKYSICKENGIKLIRIKENIVCLPNGICDEIVSIKRHPSYAELDIVIVSVLNILGLTTDVNSEHDSTRIREGYISVLPYNSLSHCRPEIADTWHPNLNGNLTSDMFSLQSGIKVWWLCDMGHAWEARVSDRVRGNGCPYCSNKKVLQGYNDLATTRPEMLEEWDYEKNIDITPETVTSGSSKIVWWVCKQCGHNWQASVYKRTNGRGCPECAKLKRKSPKSAK